MSTRVRLDIFNLRGFDAHSKTLSLPSLAVGDCLQEFMPVGTLARFDSAVAPRSGELAIIRLHAPGRPDALSCKQLERVGNRWFMLSFDGWNDFDPDHCEVLGKIVQIVKVAHRTSGGERAESMPAGFRDYQDRMLRQIMPILENRGWDRSSVFRA